MNEQIQILYSSQGSLGAHRLKFSKDFITDEPVLFTQQLTPFLISA